MAHIKNKSDYTLFLGSPAAAAANFVCIKAKRKENTSSGFFQLLGAMALIQKQRKNNRKKYPRVHDILSDGDQFKFYHLDEHRHYNYKVKFWSQLDSQPRIINILWTIFQHALAQGSGQNTHIERDPVNTPISN
ncbi:hypothetical protein BO94DRAFT_547969 [Aspergillus sclerotioniger CBS 115572]|uniref:Uncharacterized protein n=1 Tax=Aspergillus sclerotioniger CBS 115572 TaxID=1450535 RepID=A0A317W565_9EURO|nr:hypothetical protein BO94DRAFT_547969 [Aspergillus sclerotioniger CBS 115572]PWY81704.1 hypothetical protein BO94DRAFT_547969 [Aspergillus sclerotioniger CBS 115572]